MVAPERSRTGAPSGENASGVAGGASPADETGRTGVAEGLGGIVSDVAAGGDQAAAQGAGVYQADGCQWLPNAPSIVPLRDDLGCR